MMTQETLLIELGTEELPPKSLKKLSLAFSNEILQGLVSAELVNNKTAEQAVSFATPRRLAISVPSTKSSQADQKIERRGPAVQAAFDEQGKPTPAALGFAKSCGVEVDQLQRLKTDKGEWLSYQVNETGKTIADLLPDIISQAIKRLPIAKRMRWGAGNAEFVRPAHWFIVMHGDQVLDTTILDIAASNTSKGHRFHSSAALTIPHADKYQSVLEEQGHVVAGFADRQIMIEQQIEKLAKSVGGKIEEDKTLLEEVTGLVEYPTAVLGSFDTKFLDVPQECLISSMRDHQKYFHIVDGKGKLLPNFITISNIESKEPQRVIAGNERVLNARLSDAQFFWQTDLKATLESRVEKLDNVLFHAKLGSVLDKTKRLRSLTNKFSSKLNADKKIADRAAELAKADLVTDMVGEFDYLQGVMGRYYANNDNEDTLVGDCIEQHYWPKFAGDQLPESGEAQTVALADKIDSLVGIFASGETPTGDKDPYALRRAALSILRILIEKQHDLNLRDLISDSADTYSDLQNLKVDTETQEQIVEFVRGRLTAHYQNQGIPTTTINAVMACKPDSPLDFDARVKAVNIFSKLDDAENLVAANKRIGNILKKQTAEIKSDINEDLLNEAAEQKLFETLTTIEADCIKAFNSGNYTKGLEKLASLRMPVDEFFDSVMVMSDDFSIQKNRLALLQKMQQLFLRVADISLIQT